MKGFFFALALSFVPGSPTMAQSVIEPGEWSAYVEAYVTDDGRVVDIANNGISHSESQGYGLVLSALAGDRATFERIWSFTNTSLLVRDDGLAGWLWDPAAEPRLKDVNNATDGDILIAYGLVLGSRAWSVADYDVHARLIIAAIRDKALVDAAGMPALLPGIVGFDNDDRGPILNPSYWVFEALSAFADVDETVDWSSVSDTGVELVRRARLTKTGLPPDWLVLGESGAIGPAPGFPVEFGYNGIRIPLYLMRSGANPTLLEPFRRSADSQGLYRIDTATGGRIEPISEPGYRLLVAAMNCVVDGTDVPSELQTMAPTSYYAATLQLLTLDFLRREHPDCVEDTP